MPLPIASLPSKENSSKKLNHALKINTNTPQSRQLVDPAGSTRIKPPGRKKSYLHEKNHSYARRLSNEAIPEGEDKIIDRLKEETNVEPRVDDEPLTDDEVYSPRADPGFRDRILHVGGRLQFSELAALVREIHSFVEALAVANSIPLDFVNCLRDINVGILTFCSHSFCPRSFNIFICQLLFQIK
jgi:hypothetical protein